MHDPPHPAHTIHATTHTYSITHARPPPPAHTIHATTHTYTITHAPPNQVRVLNVCLQVVRVLSSVTLPPLLNLCTQVERVLSQATSSLFFNIFELDYATCGHPLSTLCFFLMSQSGIIDLWDINPVKLARYAAAGGAGGVAWCAACGGWGGCMVCCMGGQVGASREVDGR